MKKVLYVHHGVGIGGAPLSLLYLIRKMDRSQYQPKVVFLYDSAAVDLYREEGIDLRVASRWRDFSHTQVAYIPWNRPHRLAMATVSWFATAFSYARRILREENPDIVHLNSTPSSAWAYAAKKLGIRVVCHVREPVHPGSFGVRRWLLRRVLDHSVDRFIAICRQNSRALGLEHKTTVVYNFVDFATFDRSMDPATLPEEYSGRKVVLYVGGATPVKGLSVLVDALSRLDDSIIVLFAGSYEGRLREDTSKMRSAPNAHEIGVTTEIPAWIAASDVVVFPSTVPHFARPIIEAGAMGKCVVASDLDGMEELVINGETGILVPPSHPEALADTLNRICGDDETARRMGEAGYHRARELYDADANARATFVVYEM